MQFSNYSLFILMGTFCTLSECQTLTSNTRTITPSELDRLKILNATKSYTNVSPENNSNTNSSGAMLDRGVVNETLSGVVMVPLGLKDFNLTVVSTTELPLNETLALNETLTTMGYSENVTNGNHSDSSSFGMTKSRNKVQKEGQRKLKKPHMINLIGSGILADFDKLQTNGIPNVHTMATAPGLQQLMLSTKTTRICKYWLPSSIQDVNSTELEASLTFDMKPKSLVNVTRGELILKINPTGENDDDNTKTTLFLNGALTDLTSDQGSTSFTLIDRQTPSPSSELVTFSLANFLQVLPEELMSGNLAKGYRFVFKLRRHAEPDTVSFNPILKDHDRFSNFMKVYYYSEPALPEDNKGKPNIVY